MNKLYGFEVRHATEKDIPDIIRITREAFLKYCELSKVSQNIEALNETVEDIKRDIETKEVYVAFIDDVPVGSVRVEIFEDNHAYLSRFGVREDYQNNGIGKILMNVVDTSMRQKGVKQIELHTASSFCSLVRFYYGRGFYIEEVKTDRGYLRAKLVKQY